MVIKASQTIDILFYSLKMSIILQVRLLCPNPWCSGTSNVRNISLLLRPYSSKQSFHVEFPIPLIFKMHVIM